MTAKQIPFRTAYGPKRKVVLDNFEPSLTEQAHKEEVDINGIVRRYQRTGTFDHVAKYGGEYGDVAPTTYHEAMNVLVKADQMFEELPSNLRKRFNNSPPEFLEFVQNADNYDEAKELGLLQPGAERPASLPAAEPPVETPPPEAAE